MELLKYLPHILESEMGDTCARLTLYGPLGRNTIDALVDTGATFTKISRAVAEKVGFKPRREVEVVLARGEKVRRQLGNLEVEIESQRDVVPITIGEDGEVDLVGYTTLEILGFKVDPVTSKLESNLPIEY
jgi:predicted aspartyl protease